MLNRNELDVLEALGYLLNSNKTRELLEELVGDNVIDALWLAQLELIHRDIAEGD